LGGNTMKLKLTLITVALLAGCTFNLKPIYNDNEQAKAEAAVTQFHNLHNERRFDEIYARLDKQVSQAKADFTAASTETFSQWGKFQTARLDQAKVFPSNPIQVKMLYNSTFEKGNAQEWFTWNIYGDDVRLFEYRVTPGWDK
jgi:hypothetical protein